MKYQILFTDDRSVLFADETGNIADPYEILNNGTIEMIDEMSDISTSAGWVVFHNKSFYFSPYNS